jgi:succinate dehydrogenase/fumarate reductase flavoprotein subunit
VPFSSDPEGPLGLHLTREGGHAVRRIAHAADATGKAIHDVLLERVRRHRNIQLRERWMALDVITSRHLKREEPPRCYGLYALDIDQQRVETLPATAVATRPTRTRPPATASRWRGARDAASATWSSSSSTRPACTTRRSAAS